MGETPDLVKYAEITDWFERLIAEIALVAERELKQYMMNEYPFHLQIEGNYKLTKRIKTDDTLADKLLRLKTKLNRIQDFAGCRLDLECGLGAQIEFAKRLEDAYTAIGAQVNLKNYLQETQQGYRAIHLHITCAAGRSELQIRTIYQAAWANVNELLGDIFGRAHRYERIAESHPGAYLIADMQKLSAEIKKIEEEIDRVSSRSVNCNREQLADPNEIGILKNKLFSVHQELVELATRAKKNQKDWGE
ncbi:hypothetical protein CMUST_12325 [Corynebacterium mustelae]|uniref:RelA/SpoT domain-containing protein n=2 Tax=Corynebacterium mustelae TaxID=571915 RepID=A0A0G3H041_9CORY|nr:hypothetical protein CMUST_12325 [Corynebacterium mustelae]